MLMANLFLWWYSAGWGIFIKKLLERVSNLADFFSFGTLFRTFFAPFRQIDSFISTSASIGERFSAFVSRTVSRLVGACTRFFILLAGLLLILLSFIFGLIMILVWPFIPLLPIVFACLTISGVTL